MLRQHHRFVLALAIVGIVAGLVLATPQPAVAQVSVGVGVVIGAGQGPRIPPLQSPRGSWYRPGRNDFRNYAVSTGYTDGYEKGVEDARSRRSFDVLRHRRYRSADHQYERRYGPKVAYQNAYRDGFRSGYEAGYRDAMQRYRGYNGDNGRYGGTWRWRY